MRMLWALGIVISLTVSGNASAQNAPSGTVDLYVFAGQSNMRGHVATATVQAIGPSLIPAPYQNAYQAPVPWAQQWNSKSLRPAANDASTGAFGTSFVPYRAGYDPATRQKTEWGPEVAFLYNRYSANAGTIYFLKYAIGATALYFKPTIPNWNIAATGANSLLDALVARVGAATNWLMANGASGVAVHLLWAQGESDVGTDGAFYLNNFMNFTSVLQTQIAVPGVTFDVQSITLVANISSRETEANINIAATHVNAQVVDEHAYPKTDFTADNIHLGPAGQITQGSDMEALTRTPARQFVDNTATAVTTFNLTIPHKPIAVAYIPTIADGSVGLEITGPTNGLALEPRTGVLSVTDPSQLQPGQTILTLHTDTPASEALSTLVLNISN